MNENSDLRGPAAAAAGEAAIKGAAAFTPREIVSELDRYIVGQDEAKRAALRGQRAHGGGRELFRVSALDGAEVALGHDVVLDYPCHALGHERPHDRRSPLPVMVLRRFGTARTRQVADVMEERREHEIVADSVAPRVLGALKGVSGLADGLAVATEPRFLEHLNYIESGHDAAIILGRFETK